METIGEIIISIEGQNGDENLSPSNFDIFKLKELLEYLEELTQADNGGRPGLVALHSIEEGSVKNVFTASKEVLTKFTMIILSLMSSHSLDKFDPSVAKGLEGLQGWSIKNNYNIALSLPEKGFSFLITPMTGLKRSEKVLVDVEKYYYGKIVDAGGKTKSNLHLDTKEGIFVIEADKQYIERMEDNPLYKNYGVRVKAKQDPLTGEIDKSSMKLIEVIKYVPTYDEEYLNAKVDEATPIWQNVDADEYVRSIREGLYGG